MDDKKLFTEKKKLNILRKKRTQGKKDVLVLFSVHVTTRDCEFRLLIEVHSTWYNCKNIKRK